MEKKGAEKTEEEVKDSKKLNYFEGLMNFLKGLLGVGILGSPYGMQQIGWLLGLFVAALVTFILTYSTRILVRNMEKVGRLREVEDISYADAVREGFKEGPKGFQKSSKAASIIVKIFLALYHFNCGPVYTVVICSSIREVVSQYYTEIDLRIYIVLLIIPLILVMLVKSLKALTPFSVLATLLILAGLISIVYYMVATKLPPVNELSFGRCITCIPMYAGIVLLASASPGVIIAVERAMRVPKQYTAFYGVLNMGMLINFILIVAFSFMGFWRYGNHTKDNILLNIPVQEKLSQATKCLYAIALFFSYPLQVYPCIEIVWTDGISSKCREDRRYWYELLFRIGLIFITIVVALSVPFFGIIASLNGNLAVTMLGIAIPCFLDIAMRYPDNYGPAYLALVRNIIFIIIAIGLCTAGIAYTIYELYNKIVD